MPLPYGRRHNNLLIPKMAFFSIYDEKNNEVIAEKPFPNTGVTNARVAISARHSCRTKRIK